MGTFQFSRTFKREHGLTFQEFLVRYRIDQARELLKNPQMLVLDAAFAVGFNDLSYFARLLSCSAAGAGIAFEKDDINPGDQLGFAVGALLAASPETSLRIILAQTFVNESEVGDTAISDQVVGTLNFGASSILGPGKFLDLTAGMGLTDGAAGYSVGISLAVRFDIPTLF